MPAAFAALSLLVAAPSLRAQEEPGGPPFRRGVPGGPAREELFKIVDAYMVSNLQESLGLTDDQFAKLLPVVKRMQAERRGFATRRVALVVEMRRLLNTGGAGEARVAELMKDLRALEAEEPTAMRRHLDAVDAALTPVQQAKFRIMEMDVDRRIRELMNRARGPAAGPNEVPRRRGNNPQPPPEGPGV
jgi:hypothetical protein